MLKWLTDRLLKRKYPALKRERDHYRETLTWIAVHDKGAAGMAAMQALTQKL